MDTKPEIIFTESFFSAMAEKGIRYAILRNADEIRCGEAHDIDMAVEVSRMAEVQQCLFAAAVSHGWVLHYKSGTLCDPYHLKAYHFYHIGADETDIRLIHFDCFATFGWGGVVAIGNATLLEGTDESTLYHEAHPAVEAVIDLFARLLPYGYVKEKYRKRVQTFFGQCPERVRTVMQEFLSPEHAELVAEKVTAQDWAGIEALHRDLLRDLHRFGTTYTWWLRWHQLRKAWECPGIVMAIEGTDGSGKTTIIDGMRKVLANSYPEDSIVYYHWRPMVVASEHKKGEVSGAVCSEPHKNKPHGRVKSLLKLSICTLDYFFGYWCKVRWQAARGKVVVFDRYYYDFYLDKIRYRLTVSDAWLRFFQLFVPEPDISFALTGDAEAIWQRKKELPIEEVQAQIDTLERHKKHFAHTVTVDVVHPIPEVVGRVSAAVLHTLAAHYPRFGK